MKVYIWLPRLKLTQVGHSALTLDDGTHISWCPGSKKKIGSKTPREISTLSEDIRLEGREPDFTFSVSELNEAKIKIWWKQLNDSHMKYNVLKRNCCHIIIEALNAGGLKCRMPLLPKPKRVQRLMAAGCGHNVKMLELLIKDFGGKTLVVKIIEDATVESLQEKIREKSGIPLDKARIIHAGHALKSFDSGGKAMCLSDYNIKDRSTLSLDKVATLMRGDKVATLMGGDKVATFMGGAPYTELPVPMAVVLKELSDMFSMVIKEGSKRYIMISKGIQTLYEEYIQGQNLSDYNRSLSDYDINMIKDDKEILYLILQLFGQLEEPEDPEQPM